MKIILTENSPITTVEAALMGGNKMIVNRVGHSRITDAKQGEVIFFPETGEYYMITSKQTNSQDVQAVNLATGVVAFMSPFAEVDIYRNCIVTLG